jgi:hypothetical protein
MRRDCEPLVGISENELNLSDHKLILKSVSKYSSSHIILECLSIRDTY